MQKLNRFIPGELRGRQTWIVLSLLASITMLIAYFPIKKAGATGESGAQKNTMQSIVSTAHCPPPETTHETTMNEIGSRTSKMVSPGSDPSVPPSLIDFTEREFLDQNVVISNCELPAPIPPDALTAKQTTGE